MSARTIEEVLAEHHVGRDPRTHESTCSCGWQGPIRLGEPFAALRDQNAHVAAAIREWLLLQQDAFLSSPNLDPAWIAGWRSAVKHVAHHRRPAATEEPS